MAFVSCGTVEPIYSDVYYYETPCYHNYLYRRLPPPPPPPRHVRVTPPPRTHNHARPQPFRRNLRK